MTAVSGAALFLGAGQAAALDILLTNDDGFETNNIQALYDALVNAGHNVIMSAPFTDQSDTGTQVAVLRPIFPTSEPSAGGLLPAGSFGIGPTTIAAKQFYADSSPAAAALYGIDILAPQIFGGPPELVISGPNEGHDLGLTTPHSGTLGATVMALNKGIPAIAVSASVDDDTAGEAELIAQIVLGVVDAVTRRGRVQLPAGKGLNVNIPDVEPTTSDASSFVYRITQVGIAANVGFRFYENLGDSFSAQLFGIPPDIGLPGVSIEAPYTAAGYPLDDASDSEGNVLESHIVTVSPIQGTFAAGATEGIRSLFERED